jgi:hypothetical protein
MTGTFRPSVRTSLGAVKSTWMRSSLRSLSLSNGAWTQTSPLDQSAGLVEKTAWARPLTNVGTAGCGAGAGAGAATRAASAPGLPGGSADAGLAATTVAKVIAVTAPARNRVLTLHPRRPRHQSEQQILPRMRRNRANRREFGWTGRSVVLNSPKGWQGAGRGGRPPRTLRCWRCAAASPRA